MSGRLDDEKLETLRRWGAGLGADGRDELRAAGKAILILIEEIERLQVDVWHTRGADGERFAAAPVGDSAPAPGGSTAVQTPEAVAEEFSAAAQGDDGLEPTLRGRLRRLLPARQVKIE